METLSHAYNLGAHMHTYVLISRRVSGLINIYQCILLRQLGFHELLGYFVKKMFQFGTSFVCIDRKLCVIFYLHMAYSKLRVT